MAGVPGEAARRAADALREILLIVGKSRLVITWEAVVEILGDATAGVPSCVAKQVARPIRNREAPATEPQLT
jgi:hypothetical protein